ncbi:MAG: 2-succinyl-5-enolpyruvyl-6-hydroxy-3-cyclohexene-1-carboxylic-acid synthase [Bacteroidales bacterium]|nr:2-succinyl-5-enolpyruvyl-6-hydroxy-3-cyclohexene-1-carboxylic-acid synthase [Bacteroidales bacterium]
MHHLQHIAELGPLVERVEARHVIIAPGSRNAPLIQLFTSDKRFICHSIVDERSAGYVALGMARQLDKPVVVVTTSGTAVMNLSPAVAEAFQQQIPLVVLTADRPREILSQFNNQVTDQRAPYFNFSKGFFEFPAEVREEGELKRGIQAVERLFREAVRYPAGPVHLNLPLTEPLYDPLPASLLSQKEAEIEFEFPSSGTITGPAIDLTGRKVMILAGMGKRDAALQKALEKVQLCSQAVVVAENISNLTSDHFISTPELVLSGASDDERATLAPDLVIAFGQQVVSKRMKLFVQSLESAEIIELPEEPSIAGLLEKLTGSGEVDNQYLPLWKEIEERECDRATTYLRQAPFGNLTAVGRILDAVPSHTVIHLGNSTSIRNSQLVPVRPDLEYYSNRGTSGIDGSLSAAVGAAMVSNHQHLLLVGDLSFVYDSNALWNKDFPENLKIVVLNDGGGGIFRLLKGPGRMAFFEEFSVTHHPVSLELLSGAFGRRFGRAAGFHELDRQIESLLAPGTGLSVVEVDTTASENSRIFTELFR